MTFRHYPPSPTPRQLQPIEVNKRRHPYTLRDQYGRTWTMGKGGAWCWERFRVDLVVVKRRHAAPAYRHAAFEGGLELAQFDREEDAFRYVEELLDEREHLGDRRHLWRLKYRVFKGREVVETDCEMFVEAECLALAVRKAELYGADMHGGFVFVEAARKANGAECEMARRQDRERRRGSRSGA